VIPAIPVAASPVAAAPIGRDPARRLAQEELAKAIYHHPPSLPSLIQHAINSALAWLLAHASSATPGGGWSVVALAGLAVLIVGVVTARVGRVARSARLHAPVLDPGARPMTAGQLRAAAEKSAAAGDYAAAIVGRLRAIAVSCEERGVLQPDAGRTADELASQAGARFPGQESALASAAIVFDQVRYGEGTGTRDAYERLRDLDTTLARISPLVPQALATPALAAPS
jgi:hypothetical protein